MRSGVLIMFFLPIFGMAQIQAVLSAKEGLSIFYSHSIPASLENRPWGTLGRQDCNPDLNHAKIGLSDPSRLSRLRLDGSDKRSWDKPLPREQTIISACRPPIAGGAAFQ
jgi:hypothetical protein